MPKQLMVEPIELKSWLRVRGTCNVSYSYLVWDRETVSDRLSAEEKLFYSRFGKYKNKKIKMKILGVKKKSIDSKIIKVMQPRTQNIKEWKTLKRFSKSNICFLSSSRDHYEITCKKLFLRSQNSNDR